jgi:hypothetical protein
MEFNSVMPFSRRLDRPSTGQPSILILKYFQKFNEILQDSSKNEVSLIYEAKRAFVLLKML